MALGRTAGRSWLRSLYGRIAIGYVVFISVFLLAQWVLLVWINDRAERSRPQGLTRAISVGLARRLADNPDLNLNDYVRWVSPGNNVFLIMRDGRVAGARHPSDATVRSVVQDLQRSPTNGASATGEQSVYRAVPIFVNNQTVGFWQFEAKPDVFRDSAGNHLDIRSAFRKKDALDPRRAALVDFCHALLNSSEFLYVD